jgi:hypothetical protein
MAGSKLLDHPRAFFYLRKILTIACPLWLCLLDDALGQNSSRAYLGVLAGAYGVSADATDGIVGSYGITGGVRLKPWLDIEGDLIRPTGSVQREYAGVGISFAGPNATREEIERAGVVTHFVNQRRPRALVSVGASFHTNDAGARFSPAFFIGISDQTVEDTFIREPLSFPPNVTLEQVLRIQPREERHRQHIGALAFGFSVGVRLAPHLFIGPDIRYDYGSIGDEINNLWRASTRLWWKF